MNFKKIAVLLAAAVAAAFFALGLQHYFSLDYLKHSQQLLQQLRADHPLGTAAAYFAIYVALTGLSIPSGLILTLAGGAIFGFGWGLLLASFASSCGGTLAFLASRYVLRDSVQARFGKRLAEVDRGVEKEGAFYLFTLRLVPLVPFFMVNLLMGLTRMKARTFYIVSQLGMLAGTAVNVNAGTQLAQLQSVQGILSPELIGSFVLLGIFPLLARKLVSVVARRRQRERPSMHDQ